MNLVLRQNKAQSLVQTCIIKMMNIALKNNEIWQDKLEPETETLIKLIEFLG